MRRRTGSLWRDRNGDLYARVTWTDKSGVHDKRRKAMDETHARALTQEMLKHVENGRRFQPRRARSYRRTNLRIYAIQLLDGNLLPVKLGTTNDINRRVKMILTHQPYEVKVLGTWPGTVRDERDLQAMFVTSHITREWFRPTPELLAYIESKKEQKAA